MFLMRNRQDLSAWLEKELSERNWSQSDLARISGVHRAIISKIILGGSMPTPETLEAIARALKLPPEQVFRAAGLLPPKPNADLWLDEMNFKLNLLPPAMRSVAGKLIDSLIEDNNPLSQRERGGVRARSKPRTKPAKS